MSAEIVSLKRHVRAQDWEGLRRRQLKWADIPITAQKCTLAFLTVRDHGSLNSAMTNKDERPELLKAYKGLVSPALNNYLYTDKNDYEALHWVMDKDIDVKGFRMVVNGIMGSGRILCELMDAHNLDVANYYATGGELVYEDEAVGGFGRALIDASRRGYLDIVKGLLTAGADKDKASKGGCTPLLYAAKGGHVGVVTALVEAGADKDRANDGSTPLIWAAGRGHVEVVTALVEAGADWTKKNKAGKTALAKAKQNSDGRVVKLLEEAEMKAGKGKKAKR